MADANNTSWSLVSAANDLDANLSSGGIGGEIPGKQGTADLIRLYRKVEFGCAVVLALLSPITVITNGLLLGAVWRDPLKCLRKAPNTILIIGLSMMDLITGLVVEPAFVFHYFSRYMDVKSDFSQTVYIVGGNISTIAISTSFVIVLAMSLSQFIAITRPHSYRNIITKARVLILVIVTVVYFLAFSMFQFTGITRTSFLLLDVALHPTLISVCLVIVHLMMHRAFQQHVRKPARSRTLSTAWPSGRMESDAEGKWSEHSNRKVVTAESLRRSRGGISRYVSLVFQQRLNSQQRNKDLTVSFKSGRFPVINISNLETDENSRVESAPTIRPEKYCIVTPESSSTPKHERRNSNEQRIVSALDSSIAAEEEETKLSCVCLELPTVERDMVTKPNGSRPQTPPRPSGDDQILLAKRPSRNSFIRQRKPPIEKQFTIVTFYLTAILLFSCVPHIIAFFIFLLKSPASVEEEVYINAALRITDLLLFIKVGLDAFIYAWRLPSYRKSIFVTLSCATL